ncbi:MAG: sulfotransferase [Cyclobacteriaceae bacterium]
MRRIKLARRLQLISDLLPRKYPIKAQSPLDHLPFFVLGSGRNGSTMLNRMLNQHSEVFLPSEQYFLGNSIIKFKLYNFLIWRDLVKIITGELMPVTGSHTWDFFAEDVFDLLNNTPSRDLESVIDLIYRTYGGKSQRFTTWGDTTPLNTLYAPEIYSVFPKSKYIFLLRDGRDVVASNKKGGSYLGELSDPEKSAKHWLNSIDKYDWLRKRTDVLLVKYEELVSQPEAKLHEICNFLNIEFQMEMLDFHRIDLQNSLYLEPQHRNLQKPVFKSSIGNYRDDLTEEELAMVNGLLKTNLARFEYS